MSAILFGKLLALATAHVMESAPTMLAGTAPRFLTLVHHSTREKISSYVHSVVLPVFSHPENPSTQYCLLQVWVTTILVVLPPAGWAAAVR